MSLKNNKYIWTTLFSPFCEVSMTWVPEANNIFLQLRKYVFQTEISEAGQHTE